MGGSLSELAQKQSQRYIDRTELPKRKIEPLGCLWNDVIHFSPIHPAKVRAALIKAGYEDLPHSDYFVVQLSSLNPSHVAYVISEIDKSNEATIDMPADFEKQATDVPDTTKEYYKSEFDRGNFPLIYAGTLHVLYRGSVSIDGVEIITV